MNRTWQWGGGGGGGGYGSATVGEVSRDLQNGVPYAIGIIKSACGRIKAGACMCPAHRQRSTDDIVCSKAVHKCINGSSK